MTSTKFNVGLGSASRNSSKVLKPPGGGSSDIFGTTNDPEPQQRKTRNHLTSSIFGGEESQTPARKAGNDSFYNLFGAEPQSLSRPGTAVKDKFKSNIIMEDVSTDAKKSLTFPDEVETEKNGETVDEGDGMNGVHNMGTEDVHSNGVEEKEENHVATTNGDKAEPVVNGSSSAPAPVAAPVVTPAAPSATSAPPSRQRVPPGGFSSGLW